MENLPLFWQRCVCPDPVEVERAHCVDPESFADYAIPQESSEMSSAVLFVSLQMRRKLAKAGIHPIVMDSPWHFEPSLLMCCCPERMLSDDMIILPFGNLSRRHSIRQRFFIRPNSGNKTFPGQVINLEDIEGLKRSYAIRDETLVCIASERNVLAERRCIIDVSAGSIIAQCGYSHDGAPLLDFDIDFERDWRGLVPTDLLPEIVVADFALTNLGVRLIELNSISTSGLYDISPAAVYNHINSKRSAFL